MLKSMFGFALVSVIWVSPAMAGRGGNCCCSSPPAAPATAAMPAPRAAQAQQGSRSFSYEPSAAANVNQGGYYYRSYRPSMGVRSADSKALGNY